MNLSKAPQPMNPTNTESHPISFQPLVSGQIPEGVWDLIRHCYEHDQLPPIGEATSILFKQSKPGLIVGMVGYMADTIPGDETTQSLSAEISVLVGFAATPNPQTRAIEIVVHPELRVAEVVFPTIDAAIGMLQESYATTQIRIWSRIAPLVSILKEYGFVPEREIVQLTISLPQPPPEFPQSFQVRGFQEGRDEEVWLALNNQAFSDHPENGGWDRETLAVRMEQDWFDPEGVRMAWKDGRLVGFCWTKLHTDQVGEIYIIAVDESVRGQGIGRAMVLEGLRFLHQVKGARSGMLYVDHDNRVAVSLYEKMGFLYNHSNHALVLDIF